MHLELFIHFNPNPEIFNLGKVTISYGIAYVLFFIITIFVFLYEKNNVDDEDDKNGRKKKNILDKYFWTIFWLTACIFLRIIFHNAAGTPIFSKIGDTFFEGEIALHWYSFCWVTGLGLACFVLQRLYREQNIKDELYEPLILYCFFGILIGARLGHCVFYEPDYFLTSWKGLGEIIVPVRIDRNSEFTGFSGLASHGGTLGLMIALWLYVRKTKLNLWQVLDNIAIATGSTACFIRLGNLMNSEIIGKVTDVPWAFIFERVDMMPRHPGQLYEAIVYAILFFLMWWMHKKMPQKIGTGWYFGFCLTYIFTFRFFIEYTKEIQEAFEASLPLDMGQILSIPFIIIGLICIFRKPSI